jgi:membrane-associated phospholipid phosphatase
MQGLRQLLSSHKQYFIGFVLILIITAIPQLLISQNELFHEVNKLNTSTLDSFFFYLTYFGDGITFILIIIILLFYSYSKALNGLVIFLSTSLFAQLLKNLFFADHFRPFKYLSEQNDLHVPEGVSTLLNNSLPSGHTVTAFAIATFLVLIYPKKNIWLPLLLVAWLIAYSRIYLTHHFPIDVWAGSVIGTLGTLLVFWLVAAKFDKRFADKSLLNR